ncbi:glycoside hydrolase family 31 protein [Cohnella cholangitidis]|uniref:Glycoside hydrolase family 31 protein n=1 Tax=Cohnella cholangitidis TaxID=2598458 RepID=A0A7G5BYH6_9BACL|nr:TIM-barrel domain-containing protein [Cohnella cholangitidis]QMV42010.1 glycoside hydrolase family 31 protein [Cohnella cholangitidis]
MEGSAAIRPEQYGIEGEQALRKSIGFFKSLEKEGDAYICRGNKGNAAIVFLTDDVFRIKIFQGTHADLSTTPGVLPQVSEAEVKTQENDAQFIFVTSTIRLIIDKSNCGFLIEDLKAQTIAQQNPVSWDARGQLSATYEMPKESHFYGLGEKTGFLDKRGERYTNWNTDVYAPHVPEIEALYQSIPLLIHMHGEHSYGLFLDNPGRSDFDMRSSETTFSISCATGAYDIYFINGPRLKDVVSRYTVLTGRIDLPPKWAIGYHQSRYSYMNQQEVLELARSFRAKKIPCDVIYLDIHYMDEYRVFTFDPVRFPDPEGMMAELKSLGMRIIPIVDPGVKKDPKYKAYQEGVRDNHFVKKLEGDIVLGEVWPGISAFPDFTEDRTSEWWGDLHRYYTELGIQGIWNDMNEPALFNESKTMDLDAMHGNNGKPRTHEELHNLYGMLMSKATYEGLSRHLDGQRPFVLTRAGYSGIQRYAAVWTGDNRSFWEHMAMAMPMVLNMGLSGIPFAGPDIGGFAHHASGELLVRWTQMGAFFPYCRNHSAIGTVRQEPWSFGDKAEEIVRDYIGLRYRFMPYLYNLFREAATTGLPIMRPLLLEYPSDPKVTNLCDQFLLGKDLLIAPVYRPDTDHRSVYLPAGTWIDYWTGEVREGGRTILAHAPLEIMPMYVRAGAILAEGPLAQSADDVSEEPVTFHVYGAAASTGFESAYTLYEDDGVSFDYRQGSYSELSLNVVGGLKTVELNWSYDAANGFKQARKQLRFSFRRASFAASQVEGLQRLTAEELAAGAEGWLHNPSTDELLIQVADRAEGGKLVITI